MPTNKEAMREWRRKNPEKQEQIAKRYRAKQKEKREAEKANKPPITRIGKEPPSHYIKHGNFSFRGVKWNVSYIQPNNGWINIKLWSSQRVEHKANFWLAYSGKRFANNVCFNVMKDKIPDMLDAFNIYFNNMIEGMDIDFAE
jgi:hypothetical protein